MIRLFPLPNETAISRAPAVPIWFSVTPQKGIFLKITTPFDQQHSVPSTLTVNTQFSELTVSTSQRWCNITCSWISKPNACNTNEGCEIKKRRQSTHSHQRFSWVIWHFPLAKAVAIARAPGSPIRLSLVKKKKKKKEIVNETSIWLTFFNSHCSLPRFKDVILHFPLVKAVAIAHAPSCQIWLTDQNKREQC